MKQEKITDHLFQSIRELLPQGKLLVDEIAVVLNISTDSAYRRIRGEKPISFEELHLLCVRYSLSVDNLLSLKTNIIAFHGKSLDSSSFRFEEYLTAAGRQLKYMASFKQATMYHLCKDIPVFHHYQFRNLAAFKYFFWQKVFFQSREFVNQKISLKSYPNEIYEVGRKALEVYNRLDSVEIWNMESLVSTIQQVEYYHDTKAFESAEDLMGVYESLENLFTHLELQAEAGYKFDSNDKEKKPLGTYQVYFNEVIVCDNSVLALLDDIKICFIIHTGFNFMMTRDVDFCEKMYNYYQKIMRRSTLISSVSEQERSRFFDMLRKRVTNRKAAVYRND